MSMNDKKVGTGANNTWCPGCFNFQILAGATQFFDGQLKKGKTKKDFAIVTGIGCHAKLFDYVDMPGANTLHGRVPPMCTGIKIGNPNVSVYGFSGDGDCYGEGIEHLIHAARNNTDFKYLVHNNQVYALTLGEPTPTTNLGYTDKTTPKGVFVKPMNPIKMMLVSGATFVARVYAEVSQIKWVMEQAQKHKGFAFIEVIQPCIIYHPDQGYSKRFYNLQEKGHDTSDMKAAMKKADEFDYNSATAKIPLGIFFQERRLTYEEGKLGLNSKPSKKVKAVTSHPKYTYPRR